jgi:hypothetical protein
MTRGALLIDPGYDNSSSGPHNSTVWCGAVNAAYSSRTIARGLIGDGIQSAMNTKARNVVACGSLLISLGLATASIAQTQPNPIKDQLVGDWQLVSVSLDHTAPYGEAPKGNMTFDAGGHFSVIVISAGQAKNISYYGTYTVNGADNSMVIHIDGSSLSHTIGHDLKRVVAFSGDELTVQSANGGVKMTWKRASQ